MIRNVCAVLIGLIAGMAVNMAIILLDLKLYPLPEGVDFNDAEGMKAYVATLPVAVLLLVLLAHLSQAFVGGWLAARISANRSMMMAMIVGVITLLGGLYNMLSLPLPAWMWVEMPLYLLLAWAAAQIELKRRASAPTPDQEAHTA